MKKLICLLAAAALLVCCALPAFAEASGVSRADYTITAYSVDATLHENNTVTQTERITVDFAVPSRGIYRVLPVALWVEKDTADGPQEMAYRARVRDLAVTGEGQTAGAPVETDTEDGFYSIRIGDEDTWLTGVQTYELTFTYDIGDDRVAAYDELFYSLNGGRWDAPIEDFRFSFTFEKPLTPGRGRYAVRTPARGLLHRRAHGPGMGVLGFCGRRRAAGRVHAAAGAVGPAQSAGGHARVYAARRRVQRRGGLYHRQFGG